MGDNDDIRVNDNCIIFNETKDGRTLILNKGETPAVGDTVGIHPQNTEDDNAKFVTHGLNYFQPGDEVIVRKLKTGDEAAFRPGFEGMAGCTNVPLLIIPSFGELNSDGSYQYRAYDVSFPETFYRQDHDMNLYFEFDSEFGESGMQPWFPYGGVSIGFSEDGDKWYWHLEEDPYAILAANSVVYVAGPEGYNPNYSDYISMGDEWCYPDALNVNTCNARYGPAVISTIPVDLPINFMHVQIRHNSSLMWYNESRTRMKTLTCCRGVATDVDPCPRMYGDQRCD